MKPCSNKTLTDKEILFNYLLSRNRCVIEYVFGIWINGFRIFTSRATLAMDKASVVESLKLGNIRKISKLVGSRA